MLRIASWFLLICAALSSFGCDESLPPYGEPTAVLKADMYALVPLSVKYKEYAWSDHGFLPDNTTKFRISAVNAYEETFQGPLDVKGRLEVWPVLSKSDIDRIPVVWPGEMPTMRASIPITKYQIISTWLIDPAKNDAYNEAGRQGHVRSRLGICRWSHQCSFLPSCRIRNHQHENDREKIQDDCL